MSASIIQHWQYVYAVHPEASEYLVSSLSGHNYKVIIIRLAQYLRWPHSLTTCPPHHIVIIQTNWSLGWYALTSAVMKHYRGGPSQGITSWKQLPSVGIVISEEQRCLRWKTCPAMPRHFGIKALQCLWRICKAKCYPLSWKKNFILYTWIFNNMML